MASWVTSIPSGHGFESPIAPPPFWFSAQGCDFVAISASLGGLTCLPEG